jgi:hypothetical protein
MTKAEVQEALVTLYLRLNGYFTSGFIVQSAVHGENRTELDVLAVRLPNNAEPERVVTRAKDLDCWDDGMDFIVGEVKSHGQPLQFNPALRHSPEAVSAVLRWWGHLREEEVSGFVDPVLRALAPSPGATSAPIVQCPRGARVRAVLFSPERHGRRSNQAWFIPGPPMFHYIWSCFRPRVQRPTCTTVYDFGLWGPELQPLVLYFKDTDRDSPGGFSDLALYLGVS